MDSLILPTVNQASLSGRNQPVVCAQCFQFVPRDFIACTKDGFNLDYCTIQCCNDYWNKYGVHHRGITQPSTVASQANYASLSVTSRNGPVVCAQCFRLVQGDIVACKREGSQLDFCSYQCCTAYWNRYGQRGGQMPPLAVIPQGPRICCLPGCNNPCYVDGTSVHEYCGTHLPQHHTSAVAKDGLSFQKDVGITIGSQGKGACQHPGGSEDIDVFRDFASSSRSSRGPHSRHPTCRFPGCKENQRTKSGFCSSDHAKRFNASYCLFDECTEKRSLENFCTWDHFMEAVREGLCGVVNVLKATKEYETLQREFVKTWCSKKGKLPEIHHVLRIVNPSLEQRCSRYVAGLPGGCNAVEQYYHGTQLKCDIIENFDPCTNAQCGACNIARKGFDPQRISSTAWQRFGRGFYFATNSSKAYEYPLKSRAPDSWKSPHRCLLVCDIAPGRKYILHENNPSLQGAPEGYDSVYGKTCPEKRSALNYDELVVYKTESIRPHYILILENTSMDTD